jgi:hypothetical protein
VVPSVLLGMVDSMPATIGAGQMILADKNYYGQLFERDLAEAGIVLVRPTRQGERRRPGKAFLKPLRQVIESIDDTLNGPAGPRGPRRTHHCRGRRQGAATPPRDDRCDLAQPEHRATSSALIDRLCEYLTHREPPILPFRATPPKLEYPSSEPPIGAE